MIAAHKMLLDEMKARKGKFGKVVERGTELVGVWEKEKRRDKEHEVADVRDRIRSLEDKWRALGDAAEGRSQRLRVVLEAFQVRVGCVALTGVALLLVVGHDHFSPSFSSSTLTRTRWTHG